MYNLQKERFNSNTNDRKRAKSVCFFFNKNKCSYNWQM